MRATIGRSRAQFTRPPAPRCDAPVRSPQDFARRGRAGRDRTAFRSTHARRPRWPQPDDRVFFGGDPARFAVAPSVYEKRLGECAFGLRLVETQASVPVPKSL